MAGSRSVLMDRLYRGWSNLELSMVRTKPSLFEFDTDGLASGTPDQSIEALQVSGTGGIT